MQIPEEFSLHNRKAILSGKCYRKEHGETIILLHGGPGLPDEMTEVRELLNEQFQVITFDQRGIGMKNARVCSFSMADYISDINCIAGFFNLSKFHLLGHSWGGLLAQLYASEYSGKIASLFLCSPASGTGKIWTLTEKEVFQYNRKRSTIMEWIGMGINTTLGMLGSSSAYRRLFRQIIINYHKGYNVDPPDPGKLARINAMAGTRTRSAIKQHPPLENFGDTPYPVIISYGQFDAYGRSREYTLERFPHAKKVIISNCGHTPWKHNPEEFREVLRDFYVRKS
jgi:proline iminopeptidase